MKRKLKVYLFGLLLGVASLGAGLAEDAIASQQEASASSCLLALRGPIIEATFLDPQLNHSQLQRLKHVIDHLTDDQVAHLVATFGHTDLQQLLVELHDGQVPEELRQTFDAHPGLELFVVDFAELSEIFPGLLQLPNVVPVIRNILTSAQQIERGEENAQVLENEAMARRLSGSIDVLIQHLVMQAEHEYSSGLVPSHANTFMRRFGLRVRRFITPYYHRVKALVKYSLAYQAQLERIRKVDAVLLQEGLGSGILSPEESQALIRRIFASPQAIYAIRDDIREIFHPDFDINQLIAIGDFNIFASYRQAMGRSFLQLLEEFDTVNLAALDELAQVLSAARERLGLAPRTHIDYDNIELQLSAEARGRRNSLYPQFYYGATAQTSNESYQVERMRIETYQVPAGTDSQGNTIYQTITKTYYDPDTVYPSFENILQNSFDTGDRKVSGLQSIKHRTEQLRRREVPVRKLVNYAERVIQDVLKNYNSIVHQEEGLEKAQENLARLIQQLSPEVVRQEGYTQWSESQIRGQYGRDNIENFRERNGWVLKRLQNSLELAKVLQAALQRQLTPLYPVFDLHWSQRHDELLWNLRGQRNRNYWSKFLMGLFGGGGAASYHLSPEVQAEVNNWAGQVHQLLHNLPNVF